jgi:hypothetical protein
MEGSPSPEPALARWLAHGVTSLTHPLLRHALETCFHPLGIEADWLESEPFSAGDNPVGVCWLRRPRWNPARLDPALAARVDLSPWAAEAAAITVDAAGIFKISTAAADSLAGDPDHTWRAIRHSVRAAQRATDFIHAAAALILAGDPLALRYAAGDDAGFSAEIWRRFENAAQDPPANRDEPGGETSHSSGVAGPIPAAPVPATGAARAAIPSERVPGAE